ncbi:hypothetical protein M8818_004724 [Zalaria obscura]|uniref:Uncharacterized protein n=1 Tax=Zalaria obscura TaxID=2024903 RepID=A0ACC3SBY0_9PEZI
MVPAGQQHQGQTLRGDEGGYEGYSPNANEAYADEQRYMNEQQGGGGGGGGGREGGAGGGAGGRHNLNHQGPENVSERFVIGDAGGVFEDDLPGGCLIQPLSLPLDSSTVGDASRVWKANVQTDGLRTPRGKSPGRVRFESPVEARRGRGGADFADGFGDGDGYGDGGGHGDGDGDGERNRSDRRRTRGDTSDLVSDSTGANDHDPDPDSRRHSHRHRHRRRKTHSESPTPTTFPNSNSNSNLNTETKRRHRSHSPASDGSSDETVDLPPRFDAQGRRVPDKGDDPLAYGIEELLGGLGGKGGVGALLKGLLDGGSGGGRGSSRRR